MRQQRLLSALGRRYQEGLIKPALVVGLCGAIFAGGIYLSIAGPSPEDGEAEQLQRKTASIKTFEVDATGIVSGQALSVSGQLRVNNSLVLNPTSRPAQTAAGQIYYDEAANEVRYYDGTSFQGLVSQGKLDEAIDQIPIQQSSVQTPAQAVTNVTRQYLTQQNITQQTINNYGTTQDAAIKTDDNTFVGSNIFTGTNAFADVSVEDFAASGATALQGSLSVTGNTALGSTTAASLLLSSALGVASGGTGTDSLTSNEIVIGQGTGALTTITNGVPGLCLMSTATAPSFQACPGGTGSAGVNSLAGLSGDLLIANSSTAGSTITIDTATSSNRGLASFNAANLTVTGGSVNTIQDIAVTAAPTFAGLFVNGTINGQTISSNAAFSGALSVAGVITANTITPNGSMVIGANGQSLTLQGSNTSLSATNGPNRTTLDFAVPTSNVTYRLQSAAAGTYSICTTVGNCSGVNGGVTTAGGTSGALARFNGSQTLVDSILSESGSTITVNGSLAVNSITPTATMSIGSTAQTLILQGDASTRLSAQLGGITNSLLFSAPSGVNKNIVLPNASGTVAVSASGPLAIDANGNISCANCTTTGGGGTGAVDSINGINGSVLLNNSSAAGSTITIDDATTTAKGIASFNSSNFSVSGGAVNTIQDIGVSSAPTFNALTLNTPLGIASGGTGASSAAAARVNLGVAASGANTDITSLGGLSTALSVSQGGTGATGSQAAINNLSQLTTMGDLLYSDGTNSTRLARGTSGQCLTSSTTSIAWGSCGPGEADTLATVTTRGATTNTGVFLQGGATSRGLVIDTATATNDTISIDVTGGGASSFSGQITAADLTANRTWTLPDASGTFCLQGSSSCGFLTGSSSNYIQNQNASQQATSNFWISGTGRADVALQAPSFDTATTSTALNIGSTNASVLNLNQNTVLAASKSLVITGGATGTRPASPTEGMVYFDSTTKQLLVYANGKWQADKSSSTVIVAANNSKNKDAADIVVSSADEAAGNADAAITTAIASLPVGGGSIYLMEGTYTVDTGIVIPSNVTLSGAGRGATILKLKNAHNTNIFVLDMSSNTTKTNVTVQDLKIDGNKAIQTAGTQTGIYAERLGSGSGTSATSGITIRNVEVRDFRTNGVHTYLANNSTIDNVASRNNSGVGVLIDFDTMHTSVNNVESAGNGSHGIQLNNAEYIKVRNSRMIQNTGNGLHMNGTSTTNNSFEGNTMLSNTGRGAYIDYGYASRFANNDVVSNGNTGVLLNGGISESYAGMVMTGNTIRSNTGNGIEADRHVANATINGNRIFGNTAYGVNFYGYMSNENPRGNAITGNYVYSNTSGGVRLDQADNNTIQANTFTNNGGATTNNAITVSGNSSLNNDVSGNNIIDDSCTTSCYAINISGAVNTFISGNTLGNGTIADTGSSTRYANQLDVEGNLINRSAAGTSINTTSVTSSLTLQGGLTNSQLPAPAQPTVSRVGTAGTSTYGYRVTALDGTGETLPSTERTITNGNAVLDGTNYATITWTQVPGAVQYKVYRTSSNGTPATLGLIATLSGSTTAFNDTGVAATTSAPGVNTTGGLSVASNIQGANATLSGGTLTLGTTTQTGSLVLSDGSSNTATIQVGNLSGNYTYTLPVTTGNDTFCMLLAGNCSGSGVSAIGALDGGTANATGATISGSTLYLQSASNTNPGLVNTTAQTFAGDKTFNGVLSVQDVTVGASKTLTITGGATGTRPIAPAEGMVYYDTTTKSLLTYANGKWQASRSSNTKIVAASNSSQAAKDAADYVAAGTGDQTQINAALTAAAGGTVYLMEGTYTASATIIVPTDTTLAGSGRNTLIRLADIDVSDNLIEDSSSGKVTIRDLRIDGQKSLNTAGTQNGIYLNGLGNGTQGGLVENVEVYNFRNAGIQAYDCDNSKFNNIWVDSNDVGIYVYAFGDKSEFNKITAEQNVSHGIYFGNGPNNVLTNSVSRLNGGYGFYTNDDNQTVESSSFTSNTSGGMRLSNDNHKISDNVIRSNTGYGIYLDGSNIQISSNEISSNGSSGIYMPISVGNNRISDNAIFSNTGSGIEGSRNNHNMHISGNNIRSNTAWGVTLSGYIYQLISNETINNNTVSSNASGGVQLWSASSSTISANTVTDNGGATTNNGIVVGNSYSGNNNVTGNTITDTSCTTNCYAISISGSENQISSNTIGDGILVDFAGNNIYGRGEILDNGTNTIYANQRDTNGNLINRGGGGLSVNTSAVTSSLTVQGGVSNSQLPTPAQPKVATVGTAGTTTYGYRVTALDGTGETLPSTERTTTTGNAVLDGTNYNVVTWSQVAGAVQYKVYRTTSAGTPATTGLIATINGANNVFFNDTGIAGGVAAPGTNTTGGATFAGAIQGSSASLTGALTVAGATTLNGALSATNTALFKNTTNSTGAFQIQNSSSVSLFTADTTNAKIVIRSLDVSYNLTIAGHIITGGSAPTIAADAAACTAPTVSVSGTDTAGSITVTTGTGCAAPGDLATVTFASGFGAAPKVVLTPASAAAAALNAYQDDSSLTTGSFQIGVVGTPTDATVYKWHYYAVQ